MDPAKELRSMVQDTITQAVIQLFPKVRELVARQILSQFEEKFGLPQLITTKHVTKTIRVRRAKLKKKRKPVAAKTAKKPRKLTAAQMRCKHDGCSKRSKGPRYGYLCETHQPKPGARPNLRIVPNSPSTKIKEKAPRKAA